MTRTYAVLEVSEQTFLEIRKKLEAAGYEHAIQQEGEHDVDAVLDMHGLALMVEESSEG